MSTSQQSYHTQMPNELMEILMSKMVNASMKSVLTLIARKTYGFHKETDEISLTQFEKHTGLTRPTIVASLSKLQQAQLVLLLSKGRSRISSNRWQLDLSNWEEKLVKLHELVKNDPLQLVKNPLHTKEKQNKFNNYLPTSSSFKETNFGGETQPLPETRPKRETPTDVIFLSQLKKLKVKLDSQLEKITDARLNEEYELSRNTNASLKGILYYIRKYKAVLGVDHPRYKSPQVHDCMLGFLSGIWDIEQTNLPVDETVIRVVDRWFASTRTEENNLRLNHFVGNSGKNIIFYNCFQDVLLDVAYYREEANADS